MSDVKDILEWDIDGSSKAPSKEQETIVVPSKEEIIAGNDKKSVSEFSLTTQTSVPRLCLL